MIFSQSAPAIVLTAALTVLTQFSSGLSAAEAPVDYGSYLQLHGATKPPKEAQVIGTETPEIHQIQAQRPAYYRFAVPPGSYQVTVHYLSAPENDGVFSVEVAGEELVGATPCRGRGNKKNPAEQLKAASVNFQAVVRDKGLKVRFPREVDQVYAISGLEVLGDAVQMRVNCGADQVMTDSQGREWLADKELPFPDAKIQLEPNETKGEWLDIGTEILEKMIEAGFEPMPKWQGRYTRHLNGLIYDRSGRIYINPAGIGLWRYEGPGGQMYRVDNNNYASVFKGFHCNPYGPGFALFSSHGFYGYDRYQVLSWDGGDTFLNWGGTDNNNRNMGAVDWTAEGPPYPLITDERHASGTFISLDGGQTMTKVADDGEGILNSALGALGNGVFVRARAHPREGADEQPETGIYRTEDNGKTWEKVSDLRVGNNCSPIVSYENRVYAHSEEGLAKSEDLGKTWRLVAESPPMTQCVLFGETDEHMLAFNQDGGYESHDYGETWEKALPAPPAPEKTLQSHNYCDFAWDYVNDVVYSYAPDSFYRYAR